MATATSGSEMPEKTRKLLNESEAMMPFLVLKEGFLAEAPKDEMDLKAAGPNGYGEFVVVSEGGNVVRIPESERVRLAIYLLMPLTHCERLTMEATQKALAASLSRLSVQEQFRVPPGDPRPAEAKPRASSNQGVVARL